MDDAPSPLPMAPDVENLTERLSSVRIGRSKRLHTPASMVRPQGRRRIEEGDSSEEEEEAGVGPHDQKENMQGQQQPQQPSGSEGAAAPSQPPHGEKTVTPTRMTLVQEELSCSICLELCARPCTTPCGHNFCRGCLRESLKHNHRCPKCRKALPPRFDLTINTTLWNTIQLLFPATKSAPITPPASLKDPVQEAKHRGSLAAAARAVSGLMRPWGSSRPPAPSSARLDELLQRIDRDPPTVPPASSSSFSHRHPSPPGAAAAFSSSSASSSASQLARPSLSHIPSSSFYRSAAAPVPQPPPPQQQQAHAERSNVVEASQNLHQILRPIATRPRSGDVAEPRDEPRPDSAPRLFSNGRGSNPLGVPMARGWSHPGNSSDGAWASTAVAGPSAGFNGFMPASAFMLPFRPPTLVAAMQPQLPVAAHVLLASVGPLDSHPAAVPASVSHALPPPPPRPSSFLGGGAPLPPAAAHTSGPTSQPPRIPAASNRRTTAPAAPPSMFMARTLSGSAIWSPRQQQQHGAQHPNLTGARRTSDQGHPQQRAVLEHYLRPSYLPDTLADQQDWPPRGTQGRLPVPDDTASGDRLNATDQQQYLEPGPLLGLPANRSERRRTRTSFAEAPTAPHAPAPSASADDVPVTPPGPARFAFPAVPHDGGGGPTCSPDQDMADPDLVDLDDDGSFYPLLAQGFQGLPLDIQLPLVEDGGSGTSAAAGPMPLAEIGRGSPRAELAAMSGGLGQVGAGGWRQAEQVEVEEDEDVRASYGELLMCPIQARDSPRAEIVASAVIAGPGGASGLAVWGAEPSIGAVPGPARDMGVGGQGHSGAASTAAADGSASNPIELSSDDETPAVSTAITAPPADGVAVVRLVGGMEAHRSGSGGAGGGAAKTPATGAGGAAAQRQQGQGLGVGRMVSGLRRRGA